MLNDEYKVKSFLRMETPFKVSNSKGTIRTSSKQPGCEGSRGWSGYVGYSVSYLFSVDMTPATPLVYFTSVVIEAGVKCASTLAWWLWLKTRHYPPATLASQAPLQILVDPVSYLV